MFSETYRRYVLAALSCVYAVNLLDRGIMFMLMQAIKHDLDLTDTQLGLLGGFAFTLFYATLGVPIARWSDRGNRATITSLAIALWALTTAASAIVTNFVQILFARIAAGAGDAGCQPPIYSLLGDYFPKPDERTRALYVLEAAVPLSGLASFIGAGWINDHFGWRLTLALAAVPGFILAFVVKFTIKDPRAASTPKPGAAKPHPPLRAVFATLWGKQSCRHLAIAMVLAFAFGGVVGWQVPFLIRTHGMTTSELGLWMGVIHVGGTLVGIALGGFVLSQWFASDAKAQMRWAAFALALGAPINFAFLLIPDPHLALLVLIPHQLIYSAFVPATFVLLQRLVPDDMRATALMIILLFASLIGGSLGTQIVGLVSDALRPTFGDDGLRYAMMLVSLLAAWSGYHLWLSGQSIREDLADRAPPA